MADSQDIRTQDRRNSLETILTFDNSSFSLDNWSVAWSTEHVPGMDNAAGGRRARRGGFGRRRLWYGSFALGAMLTMHVRVNAAMLSAGFLLYTVFMLVIVAVLANPMRHFEIFLGQWSLSGPGRAFRIVPMLDGIGIAVCINAIMRAICCICIAAITCIYLMHTIADKQLPYTYCRDYNMVSYYPEEKLINILREGNTTKASSVDLGVTNKTKSFNNTLETSTEITSWTNDAGLKDLSKFTRTKSIHINLCKEVYSSSLLQRTPAYNFFFVEVMLYKSDYYFGDFNLKLAIALIILWACVWGGMVFERTRHGRLIWNNMPRSLVIFPCVWSVIIIVVGCLHLSALNTAVPNIFRPGSNDMLCGLAQAASAAMYIHAAGIGTELIYGKGLNHYASGHIDPLLNGENVLHSSLLVVLSLLNATGAAICAVVDNFYPDEHLAFYGMRESTLWMLPMYSKCVALGRYAHLLSTLVFGGLTLSYTAVAYIMLKSALHTIFEYRVKLVFVEQGVVAGLILVCMSFSMLLATNGGLRLLETVEDLITGLAMSYVCFIQLVTFIYAYRSHDFISDINMATEENTCSTRISTQWKIIPTVTGLWFMTELVHQFYPKLQPPIISTAVIPFICIVMAVPLRAAINAYTFLRPAPRHGT